MDKMPKYLDRLTCREFSSVGWGAIQAHQVGLPEIDAAVSSGSISHDKLPKVFRLSIDKKDLP